MNLQGLTLTSTDWCPQGTVPIKISSKSWEKGKRKYVLSKLYKDWTKNMTSRVLYRFNYSHIKITVLTPGTHIFKYGLEQFSYLIYNAN